VRVLQNHLGARVADVERRRFQIHAAGKTLLVHLEALAGFEAHVLFRRFNRLPAFVLKQGNDLRGGNEGVAGREARPGGLGKYRGSNAAEILGRKYGGSERAEGAGTV